MNLFVVGINHEKAPIDIREKLSFSKNTILLEKDKFKKMGFKEFIILSTCNRSEIYVLSEDLNGIKKLNDYLISKSGIDISEYLFIKKDQEFLNHIYCVSCGLNSAIFCEDQILGQVKEALNFAMENGTSGKILNKIFREAITFSKKIRSSYKISENQTSVSAISIKFMEKKLNGFQGKNILVVGSGDTGRLTIKYLKEKKDCNIYLTNRSKNHIVEIINDFEHIKIIDYDKKYDFINRFDGIFSATSSPHFIFKYEEIKNNIKKDIVFMDLAVPRDIDEKINQIAGLSVYTVDDLKFISENSLKYRKKMESMIISEIENEVKLLTEWIKKSKVDFLIKKINEKGKKSIFEIKDEIFKRFNPSAKEKDKVEKIIESSVKKIFKDAIITLKKLDDESDIDNYKLVISNLFNIEEEI